MLKKLFVYDMRALSKLLIIAHIPLILLAFLLRFTIVDALSHLETNDSFAILAGALLVLFFCYLAVVAFLTEVYFAYYTYKNLFSDQGYLTLTLPATPAQQVGAKVLSGTTWILIDQVVIYLSCAICIAGTNTMSLILDEMQKLPKDFFQSFFGMSFSEIIAYFMGSTLVNAITAPCIILGALCLGQLFSKNRILIAVVTYFCYCFLVQIVASGYMGYQMASTANSAEIFAGTPYATTPLPGMKGLFILSTILCAAFGVLGYFFSNWCMRKKINLH